MGLRNVSVMNEWWSRLDGSNGLILLLYLMVYLRKDVLAIEGVQRRFTRLIPGMAGLSYEERLSRLGLYSLEFRRVRGNLIETCKILTGLDRVDSEGIFPMVGESRIRGHRLKIRGKPFRTEVRRNFFTQRVVNVWNSLP